MTDCYDDDDDTDQYEQWKQVSYGGKDLQVLKYIYKKADCQ